MTARKPDTTAGDRSAYGLICQLFAGPSVDNRLHKIGQWNSEKHTEYAPESAKDQNRNDDCDRVQVVYLRKQQWHEYVGV